MFHVCKVCVFTQHSAKGSPATHLNQIWLFHSQSVICSAAAPLLRDTSRIFAWFAAHARPPHPFFQLHNPCSLPSMLSAACIRIRRGLVFKSISQKWHVRAKLANILPLNWGYRQVLPIMLDTLRLRLHHKRQRVPWTAARRQPPRIKEWSERGTPTAHSTLGVCVRACYLICSRTRRNVVGHLRVASSRGLNHIFIAGGAAAAAGQRFPYYCHYIIFGRLFMQSSFHQSM